MKFTAVSVVSFASMLIVGLVIPTEAPAYEKPVVLAKEKARVAFQKKLQHLEPALTGGSFKEWNRDYQSALKNQKKWERAVAAVKDEDTRTTRAGEVIAFSGTYRMEPVAVGSRKFPIRTKGKYQVFVFRPTQQLANGKWIDLPKKIRDRKYLLVRGMVPRQHDPYCIVACTYLGIMTDREIERLVKESCEF